MVIASSKSILGHGSRFDGEEVSPPQFLGAGEGVVRYHNLFNPFSFGAKFGSIFIFFCHVSLP